MESSLNSVQRGAILVPSGDAERCLPMWVQLNASRVVIKVSDLTAANDVWDVLVRVHAADAAELRGCSVADLELVVKEEDGTSVVAANSRSLGTLSDDQRSGLVARRRKSFSKKKIAAHAIILGVGVGGVASTAFLLLRLFRVLPRSLIVGQMITFVSLYNKPVVGYLVEKQKDSDVLYYCAWEVLRASWGAYPELRAVIVVHGIPLAIRFCAFMWRQAASIQRLVAAELD